MVRPHHRAIAPARLHYYTDLPLTALFVAAMFAAFSKHLEDNGCQAAAIGDGNLAHLPVFVPESFPCGMPTLHQATWLFANPSAAFLLSADPMHRCWMFVASVLTPLARPLVWLLSSLLFSAASPSASACRQRHPPSIRLTPPHPHRAQGHGAGAAARARSDTHGYSCAHTTLQTCITTARAHNLHRRPRQPAPLPRLECNGMQ